MEIAGSETGGLKTAFFCRKKKEKFQVMEPEAGTEKRIRQRNYFKGYLFSGLIAGAVKMAALLTMSVIVFLVGFIIMKGVRYLTPELFSMTYNSDNVSLMPALMNTLTVTILSLLTALPVGLSAAIYLSEYARKGSRFVKLLRIAAETLSGIPSIIYGLFGLLFFGTALGWGYSLLSGSLTLVIMILPVIIRTSEEALLAVPLSYREASFGLGAGKMRTVFKAVLPAAMPGILSGVVLSVGRIVGETAALLYTAGSVAKVPADLMGSGRTLAVHMYVLSSEGLYMNQAFATAVVLLVFVLLLNALADLLGKKLTAAGRKSR